MSRAIAGHGFIGHVYDDRILLRTRFGLKDFGDGFGIQRIGGEAIDRLRRHRYQAAGPQHSRGAFHRLGELRRRFSWQHISLHTRNVTGEVNRDNLGQNILNRPREIPTLWADAHNTH